jgi:hypothetical protein
VVKESRLPDEKEEPFVIDDDLAAKIEAAERRAREGQRLVIVDRLPVIDIDTLPLPQPGPGASKPRFLAWIDVCRHILEREHLRQLSKQDRRSWDTLVAFGQTGFPKWEDHSDIWEMYKELQLRADREDFLRQPYTIKDVAKPSDNQPAEVSKVPPQHAELVEPAIMHWSTTTEDAAGMNTTCKKRKAQEASVAPVVLADLPWLPPGPAKILALLRHAADSQGRVSVSQNTIATETGLDRRYVQRLLDRLVESTLLELVRQGYGFKKNGKFIYQPGQYRLAGTPDRLKAKEVLIRPAGRKKK